MRGLIAFSIAALLSGTAARAEPPRVVSDIPPVHGLVAAVWVSLERQIC